MGSGCPGEVAMDGEGAGGVVDDAANDVVDQLLPEDANEGREKNNEAGDDVTKPDGGFVSVGGRNKASGDEVGIGVVGCDPPGPRAACDHGEGADMPLPLIAAIRDMDHTLIRLCMQKQKHRHVEPSCNSITTGWTCKCALRDSLTTYRLCTRTADKQNTNTWGPCESVEGTGRRQRAA